MNNILENLNNSRDVSLTRDLDLEVSQNLADFKKVTESAVNSGIDYIIKSLNCDNEVKNSLTEMKKIFKAKDFKEMMSMAVESSLKLGLEVAKKKFPVLKTLDGIKEISVRGGIGTMLSSTVDIMSNKYLKGNLIGDNIKVFLDDVKSFLKSNSFINKIEQGINRVKNNIVKFNDLCSKWYESYEKFDITNINNLADTIKKFSGRVSNYNECIKESNIIQNMTALINNKMDKLSKTQMEVCANL